MSKCFVSEPVWFDEYEDFHDPDEYRRVVDRYAEQYERLTREEEAGE